MARLTTTSSLEEQPEVFFSTTPSSRAIRRLLDAGEVRHVKGRLYTKNLADPLEDVVRRGVWDIAAGYFPGAVIVDRTAFEPRPAGAEGSVFLCRRRLASFVCRASCSTAVVALVRCGGSRRSWAAGLYLSSWPRRFLETCAARSRARWGPSARSVALSSSVQLEAVLVNQGEAELNVCAMRPRGLPASSTRERERRTLWPRSSVRSSARARRG